MGRDKGITVYGPKELESIIKSQLEIGGAKLDFDLQFVATDPKNSQLIFEDKLIEIHSFPLKHRIPTTGFLIREKAKEFNLNSEAIKGSGLKIEHFHLLKKGEDVLDEDGQIFRFKDYTFPPKPSYSYAFCSDTKYDVSIVPYVKDVSVLYHEATFTEKDSERAKATFHSTAAQAADIAKRANAGKLYLGHLSARYESTAAHLSEAAKFFDNTEVVEDGMKFTISA
jgi:ribonuclease Z